MYKTLDMEVEFSDHFVTSVFSSDSPWGGIGPLEWTRPASSALWGGLGRSPSFRLNLSRHFEWAILSQGVPSGSGVVHCVCYRNLVGRGLPQFLYVSLALCQFQGRVTLGGDAWD